MAYGKKKSYHPNMIESKFHPLLYGSKRLNKCKFLLINQYTLFFAFLPFLYIFLILFCQILPKECIFIIMGIKLCLSQYGKFSIIYRCKPLVLIIGLRISLVDCQKSINSNKMQRPQGTNQANC